MNARLTARSSHHQRLVLERHCAEAFSNLLYGFLLGEDFTLVLVDFAAFVNAAFKTTLRQSDLVRTVEPLLESWNAKTQQVASPEDSVGFRFRAQEDIDAVSKTIVTPPGVGFALVIGKRSAFQCVASGDRERIAKVLQNELLPRWRGT